MAINNQQNVAKTAGKDLAVSALAAAIAHVVHHPLYTLKSQMMYYGPQFKYRMFLQRAWREKRFLFRGIFLCYELWFKAASVCTSILNLGEISKLLLSYCYP